MDPALFLADLEAKPAALRALAARLAAGPAWPAAVTSARRLLLLGMGSSRYAASVAAARLRAAGADAVAENAASDLLPPMPPDGAVIAVSAGGGSPETAAAVERYRGRCPVVLLTNTAAALAARADHVVELHAGPERGGVACRSYQHTVALLLALEAATVRPGLDVPALVGTAAAATRALLDSRPDWLPAVTRLLASPDGSHVVAPARRLASARQSALMLREGPRVASHACETADWSHVDVYLTRTLDYRMLLLAGSRWEDGLLGWAGRRGATVVAVGGEVPGAAACVRYPGDDVDDVRLLTEVLVAELTAAALWQGQR